MSPSVENLIAAQPGTDFDSKIKGVVVRMINISAMSGPERELLPKALMGTPIQRIAAPEDIAAFVSYVASDNAGFMTGKVDSLFLIASLFTQPCRLTPRRPMCMFICPLTLSEVYLVL